MIAACVKWVDLRPDIDHVQGHVAHHDHGFGFSPADRAAVEIALRLGEAWGSPVAVVCAGPPAAEDALLHLAASGAGQALRIEHSPEQPSAVAADVLAPVLGPGDLAATAVVCGDLSYDRGSGSVPALLAHHLGHAQALGLIAVNPLGDHRATAVRRLDGGRRERLALKCPTVLSVEGSVAALRRASLAATRHHDPSVGPTRVELRRGRIEAHVEPPRMRPWRPRARVLPAPAGSSAFERILHLTDALVDRTPSRTIVASPNEAADLLVDQLTQWGHLDPEDQP